MPSHYCACAASLLICWQGNNTICKQLCTEYALFDVLIISKKFEMPATRETRYVIQFMNSKGQLKLKFNIRYSIFMETNQ